MKIFTLGILAAFGLTAAQENLSTWAHFKNVFLNTSSSGANVTALVTRFPVLVRLDSTNADVFAGSAGRGADLRFAKMNGTTRLPHQVNHWDSAGKTAAVWVLADSIFPGNGGQSIRMYWGKAGAVDSSNGRAVFGNQNGYSAVWHMNEQNPTDSAADATANQVTLRPSVILTSLASDFSTPVVPGVFGRGRRFVGGTPTSAPADKDNLVRNKPTNVPNVLNPDTAVSISVWMKPSQTANLNRIFQKTRISDNTFSFIFRGTSGECEFGIGGTSTGQIQVPDYVNGQWRLLQLYANTSSFGVSIDGDPVFSNTREGELYTEGDVRDSAYAFVIGSNPNSGTAGNYFQGDMDEFRFSHVTRSDAWNRLEFQNQKPAQSLVVLGGTDVVGVARRESARPAAAFTARATGSGFTFRFAANGGARVSISDLSGRAVWSRETGDAKGSAEVTWNGDTREGRRASRGAYVVSVEALDMQGNITEASSKLISYQP
jgi:hypothetical protein